MCPLYRLFSSALPRKIVGTLGAIKVLLPSYSFNKCIPCAYSFSKCTKGVFKVQIPWHSSNTAPSKVQDKVFLIITYQSLHRRGFTNRHLGKCWAIWKTLWIEPWKSSQVPSISSMSATSWERGLHNYTFTWKCFLLSCIFYMYITSECKYSLRNDNSIFKITQESPRLLHGNGWNI